MTPGVVWQLTNHYERGSRESEQAHAHLAARLRRLLTRRRLLHREAGHGSHSQVKPSLPELLGGQHGIQGIAQPMKPGSRSREAPARDEHQTAMREALLCQPSEIADILRDHASFSVG